ncbi:hypothetical protein BJF82_04615 [Kytococcus sp. CUA-901]|nr:hypothetical protein BJF82_04615 [Kytococcus sp. CUA-901]
MTPTWAPSQAHRDRGAESWVSRRPSRSYRAGEPHAAMPAAALSMASIRVNMPTVADRMLSDPPAPRKTCRFGSASRASMTVWLNEP